ncbi:MAG: ABC transporter ATP-binding protein [Lachnospiraceae bacterium]|nr:ABC transporter ATP-binding protein [Lachnospiraceae bacterium]
MNKQDFKNIWLILRNLAMNYKKVLVSMFLMSVSIGVRPYVAVVLTGILIDAVYEGASFEILLRYALYGVGITSVFMLIETVTEKIFNQHLEYMFEIQNRPLNEKSMEMDYEYLEDAKVHDSRQRLNSAYTRFGIQGSALSHISKITTSISSCVTALIIVIPMFFRKDAADYGWIGSPVLSIVFFALMGFFVWVNYKVLVYYNTKSNEIRKEQAPWENRKKFYMDLLASAEPQKDLRIYGQKALFQKQAEKIVSKEKAVGRRSAFCMMKSGLVSQAIVAILGLLVYGFAGLRGYVGMITIGNVVTYASSISKVSDSIYMFAHRLGWLKGVANYAVHYVDFMALQQRKHEGTIPMEKRRDNKFTVEFENVSFQYPGSNTYVIKDLNLSFVIGEKMAIVGKNGSGKTTFIKLLCRLYDVTEGCIKVNGIDIRKYDYKEYCDLFAVVFQDFCMFDFPVGENMACSTQVDEAKAMDALERAGLGDRMKTLPEGLQTYVGKGFDENGVNFSGGEKQKMAIARAIYKDAPFVIMDEPTAALDPEAECEVFAGFDKMVGKKTAIYISHRLASCRFCEDILVFDKGQVVQRGSHEKLEQEEGLYRELWNAQAQYYA